MQSNLAAEQSGLPQVRLAQRPRKCRWSAIPKGFRGFGVMAWFRLPTRSDLTTMPAMRKKRILLADDDDAVREMLGRVLRSADYDVTVAATGRAAASRFAAKPPDLVLFDLNLPEGDARTDFESVCAKHPLIPVIVTSARSHEEERAAQLGADVLMEKPLDLPRLLAVIRSLVGGSDLSQVRHGTRPDFKSGEPDASRQLALEALAL